MNPFASTPVSQVKAGDIMVWQYVTGIWQNDDDTYSVMFRTLGDIDLMTTVQPEASINAVSINCPKCGHHINPNVEGE